MSFPEFSRSDLAAILAGLRNLQLDLDRGTLPAGIGDVLTNGGETCAPSSDEIDELCERINCGCIPVADDAD